MLNWRASSDMDHRRRHPARTSRCAGCRQPIPRRRLMVHQRPQCGRCRRINEGAASRHRKGRRQFARGKRWLADLTAAKVTNRQRPDNRVKLVFRAERSCRTLSKNSNFTGLLAAPGEAYTAAQSKSVTRKTKNHPHQVSRVRSPDSETEQSLDVSEFPRGVAFGTVRIPRQRAFEGRVVRPCAARRLTRANRKT